MRGRDHDGLRRRRTTAVALSLAALLSAGALAPATEAKKKKKKKAAAVTKSATVPLSSGAAATGAASCTGKTHMTGGGLAIAPAFTPPASGLQSVAPGSSPSGAKGWSTAAGAFNTPAASGTLTSYVRCESNRSGQLVNTLSTSATLPPGQGTTSNVTCAPGTHVITGGYQGTGIVNFADPNNGYRIVVLVSRRTSARTWTVNAFNSSNANTAATITVYATCERNAKGVSVSEAASAPAAIDLSQRSGADATCGGKTHVVSGGFAVSPNGIGDVPGVTIDETFPAGRKGWHVGLYNLSIPPPGSNLQAFAYCKKG
jgi:hypothetical protein